MKFDRVLLLVAVSLIIGGLVSILTAMSPSSNLDVASVLTAMPPNSNLDLGNLGEPQPEHLKRLCVLYEQAKQELVQFNLQLDQHNSELVQLNASMHSTISGFRCALGGFSITFGMFAWLLRGVADPSAQKPILKAFLVATLISFAFTIHLTLFVTPGSKGWIPLGGQVLLAGLLFSGLNRLRKAGF